MVSTNWTNITNFEGLITEANTHAPFWSGMLLMMWIVLIITFLPFGTSVAFIGGSFSALLIGLLLVYMGLVSWKIIMMMVGVILLIIIVGAMFSKKEQ